MNKEYIEHFDGEFAKRLSVCASHRKASDRLRELRQKQAEAAMGQAEPLTDLERVDLSANALFLAGEFMDLIGA